MLLGFDIGGTKCAVVTAEKNKDGITITAKEKVPTDLNISPAEMIDRLITLADKVCGGERPEAIGISCGGPLDSDKGLILGPPNLPGWDCVPIVEQIKDHFGAPVHLQNDANACALAEWKFGAGKGTKNMIFLTFGTGLGAGLILDGRLYTGTNDNAGEVGHIRIEKDGPVGYGKCGSFEGFCSGGGLAQLGKQYLDHALKNGIVPAYADDEVNAKTISIAADNGDVTAIEVYKTCGEKLGQGLSVLIDILNPECIVIGSIFTRSQNLLWQYTKEVIDREALPISAGVCRVVPAMLGESLGDHAAICVALLEENKTDDLFARYPVLNSCRNEIRSATETIISAFQNEGKLLLCGNGGSCADCEHIVGELMKGFISKRALSEEQKMQMKKNNRDLTDEVLAKLQRAVPAISLPSFAGLNTAFCNDVDPELVYAQCLMGLGRKNDVLMCISTSGNSRNCVAAAQVAKGIGLTVIALTGQSGGKLKGIADICICAPESETYKVQELHLPIYHHICMEIERALFG